jgi:tetratricopeptide (TPR) repeat protein
MMIRMSSQAAEVRLSFLNDETVLQDTIALLNQEGCSKEVTAAFQKVVEHYYSTPFNLDYGRFPVPHQGFYSFTSPNEAVAALPGNLRDTEHAWEFNCFDTMLLLASYQMKVGLKPDEHLDPFIMWTSTTNGQAIIVARTPGDAFAAMQQPWYLEATKDILPTSMNDARICFSAALFCVHLLPLSTSEATLQTDVLHLLRSTWRRQKLEFPKGFEVVLCHDVDLPTRTVSTPHTGLLFPRGKGYTYLEKSGGSGPFIRLDLENQSDLLPWLAAPLGEHEPHAEHVFATFNDSRIEHLRRREQQGKEPRSNLASIPAPVSADAYVYRGLVEYDRGDLAQAIENLSKALKLNPTNASALDFRGTAYLRNGDWQKAILDCDRAIQLTPSDFTALLNRACAYRATRQFDKALEGFSACIQVDPRNDFAYKSRAATYEQTGKFDEAIADWTKGLEITPNDATALAIRGYEYAETGRFEQALSDCTEALRIDSKNEAALDNLAWLRASCPLASMRNGHEAVKLAREACEQSKWTRSDSVDTLAAALAEAGEFEEAVRQEKRALKMIGPDAAERVDMQHHLSLYESHQPYRIGGQSPQ